MIEEVANVELCALRIKLHRAAVSPQTTPPNKGKGFFAWRTGSSQASAFIRQSFGTTAAARALPMRSVILGATSRLIQLD